MTTQNTTQTEGTKRYINLATKKRGHLGADAEYFDRTCSACRGMYSSSMYQVCPKCGAALTFLTMGTGKAMTVTECVIYPLILDKDIKRLKDRAEKDASFMPITYRFKMFSFSENGVLQPPPELMRLKKGAMVEFVCYNTPEHARKFYSKKLNRECVELTFPIFKDRGSSVKVISDPKQKAEYAIPYKADDAGNPLPIAPPFPMPDDPVKLQKAIDAMEKQVATMKAAASALTTDQQPAVAVNAAGAGEDDPFDIGGEYVVDDVTEDAPF